MRCSTRGAAYWPRGDININRFFAYAGGYREIALVVKEPHQTRNIGGWHIDHSYDQLPTLR